MNEKDTENKQTQDKEKTKLYKAISESAGEDVLPVVKYLEKEKDKSEFEISEALDSEVKKIRSALYRLQTHNLVDYFKKKDKEKGWYISYWSFNSKHIVPFARSLKQEKIRILKARLNKELKNKDNFFICPKLCKRLKFDEAVESSFRCFECNSLVLAQNNARTIKELQNKIDKIRKES